MSVHAYRTRSLLVLGLISLALIGARRVPFKQVRLTIVNKSGLAIEVSLIGAVAEKEYTLRVPKGNRIFPAEKTFDIFPDTYQVQSEYIELWDPVYGYDCTSASQKVDITHNTRIVVLECDRSPACPGEPTMVKMNSSRKKASR